MYKQIIGLAIASLTIMPAFAQDLKPEMKSEDVIISNTFKAPDGAVTSVPNGFYAGPHVGMYPAAIAAKPVNLDDLSNVVAAKEQKRLARVEANHQLDLQYKAIPNKPSKFFHPIKRTDLWADYHQDTMRKYRTRGLPIGQGLATVIGMGFSIGAALK